MDAVADHAVDLSRVVLRQLDREVRRVKWTILRLILGQEGPLQSYVMASRASEHVDQTFAVTLHTGAITKLSAVKRDLGGFGLVAPS